MSAAACFLQTSRERWQIWPFTGHAAVQRPAMLGLVLSLACLSYRQPLLAMLLLRSQSSGTESAGAVTAVTEPQHRPREVDYVIGNVWLKHSEQRALEIDTEQLDDTVQHRGQGSDDGRVRRLVVPMRLQDVHFLRLVTTEHLRVDLWPHRSPEPHVHVRILTNAVSFQARKTEDQWRRFTRFFSSDGSQWLTLMQAVVHLPRGVSLMSCNAEWRWADFNETEASWREALAPPFRVLEIACSRRPRGFLLPGPIVLPPSRPDGRMATKDVVVSCFRVAFVAILIIVCIAQVVLLMVCITMLVVQIRMQRRGQV